MEPREVLKAGAACSAVAGLIHVVNAPEHLGEWWGYGLFFLFASVAQFWFALGLLADWHAREPGLAAPELAGRVGTRGFVLLGSAPRTWHALGVAGNASIVLLYVVTRTVGIPPFGPAAGEVEPLTPLGVASKAFELVLIALLLTMLRAPSGSPRPTAA
ncbi:MAG: hypothetical protein LC624_03395 [Halobacteriales archaeon]|nr:hypothetical protein [Halobacteriales archaeon]